MQERFTLRFESGERAGEVIPVPVAGLTVGRRAGNTVVIADPSVSGRHAELASEGGALVVRDLGSTNGTRVGGERIEQARLAHGDRVQFGNIALLVQDARLAERGPAQDGSAMGSAKGTAKGAAKGTAPSAAAAGEGVARLDAAGVQRGARRSRAGLVLVVLALAGAGVAAWVLAGGGEAGGPRLRPVEPVAGNLLADGYSFEQGEAGWENAPGASAFFERSPAARHTGGHGMRAALGAGERAQLLSPAHALREGGRLRLVARLRVGGAAHGRVAVELLGPAPTGGGEARSLLAFGPWIAEVPEHEAVELELAVPAGFERARVLAQAVAAGAEGGRVDLDDVALVPGTAPLEPVGRLAEYRLFLLGQPTQTLQLQKVTRPLISDLRVELSDAELFAARDAPLGLTPLQEGRFALELALPRDLPPGLEPRLVLRGEGAALAQGLATIGGEGYQLHSLEFDQEGVRSLLLGDGPDLVGLIFEPPVRVRSRALGEAARIEIRPAPARLVVQLDFGAERAAAGQLAFAARNAQGAGRLGEALALWGRLLAESPFERRLVEEAEAARGKLVGDGLAELAEVERDLERARFFRLADLYRRARDEARAIGARYASSEVEQRAALLAASVDAELGDLETELIRDEVERLRAIRALLEAQGSSSLASAVASYLDETYGTGGR